MTDNSVKPLSHYGIHLDAQGQGYLFQDLQPRGWNFIGCADRSNMTVKHLKGQCTHNINPFLADRQLANKHWTQFTALMHDPLVNAMLPVPNGGVYYFDEAQLENLTEWMVCLERLHSPMHPWVKPLWSVSRRDLHKQMQLSNIHPLVLTNCSADDLPDIRRIVELSKASPRTVILCGPHNLVIPKEVERLRTSIHKRISLKDLISLPLEHIGSELIARYCRGQPLLEAADSVA